MKTLGRLLLLVVLVGLAFGVVFYERPVWVEIGRASCRERV